MTRKSLIALLSLLFLLLICTTAFADFTLVQISDTHVGVKQAAYNARYQEVIRQVNEMKQRLARLKKETRYPGGA